MVESPLVELVRKWGSLKPPPLLASREKLCNPALTRSGRCAVAGEVAGDQPDRPGGQTAARTPELQSLTRQPGGSSKAQSLARLALHR